MTIVYTNINHPDSIAPEIKDDLVQFLKMEKKADKQEESGDGEEANESRDASNDEEKEPSQE